MFWRRFLRVHIRPQILITILAAILLVHGLARVYPMASAASAVTFNDSVVQPVPRVLQLMTELKPLPVSTDCNVQACVALTFDDGPEPEWTPKVLDILGHQRVTATFFVQGYRAARYPTLIKWETLAGHSVQNHSWNHPDFRKLSHDQIRQQIDATQNAVVTAGAPPPRFFRPPYGWRNDRVRSEVDKPFVMWNVDPQEWRSSDTRASLVEAVVSHAKRGSIILLHDTKPLTSEALDEIITKLKVNYQLVTIDELLKLPAEAKGEYLSQ